MSVFVTDGNQRSTLAVVRALGREGIPVSVGETTAHCLASSSRYCSRSVAYPSPEEAEEAFGRFVSSEMAQGGYKVLLPMTDITMQIAAEVKSSLAPQMCMPIPGAQQIARVQDKRYVVEIARRVGISCPETWTPDRGGVDGLSAQLRYPVVIKPRFSRFRGAAGWTAGEVTYAASPAEFVQRYRDADARIPEPLVQERIEGEGRGVFLLLWNGELKAAFCHRRLREKPPWGGVSVYRESLPLDEALVSKSAALLRALDWQGVAMVEYKVDPRGGVAKLMEVNGRFWGSLQLALDAGLNFPAMLYRLAIGEDVAPNFRYSPGVRSRWLLGDLDHLLIRLRRSVGPNGVAIPGSRVQAVLRFLKLWEPRLHYEVWRFDDPSPGWFECRTYLRDAFRTAL